MRRLMPTAALAAALFSGTAEVSRGQAVAPKKAGPSGPTAAEAARFVGEVESRYLELSVATERANWVQSNFITEDTEALAAEANERRIVGILEMAQKATRFDGVKLPAEVRRKLDLLKLSLVIATPKDRKQAAELTRITAGMEGAYGRGKWCPAGQKECLDLTALSRLMATSREEKALRDAWVGWHGVAPSMKKDFTRYVELANAGARELGFKDTGVLWRSKYDMPPDEFAKEMDRLWEQVRPFYVSLHSYVRWRLRETYGPEVVPEKGPIPAHLLGNMWAQEWGNIYPLVAPKDADPGFDVTERLKAKKADEREMVRYGERFFTSLGFAPLPATFWERSLFTKPRDREVVCHASAWDVDWAEDLRIKMCIEITGEAFSTIHHELGHNFYQRAYKGQPPLFRDSANDGFHEAVGDTLALSITPSYLRKINLLESDPPAGRDIGLLLNRALDKVAFLPFGLLIDQWRWKVFSGEITPDNYNAAWWSLREKYQGVAAPVARSEADFDPAAKYHVAANVPYARYFLADILQFQFHRGLCRAAGETGPLHLCSIYGNKEAGRRLNAMLEMGQSRPWPDALEALTGERRMDASALTEYFAPLKAWLDQQNAGHPVGW
jgi:peptidyl-dipeptidase A